MVKPRHVKAKLKVYEIYVNRISKEGDFFWTRFKIYFGFNAGAFLSLGFLIKPYIEKASLNGISTSTSLVGVFLSLIGIIITWVWYLITKDGCRWQSVMNTVIAGIERGLFVDPSKAMYTTTIKVDA